MDVDVEKFHATSNRIQYAKINEPKTKIHVIILSSVRLK